MKKVFVLLGAATVGFSLQAAFLYWQVSPEPQSQNMGTTINAEYARVVAVKDGDKQYLESSVDFGGGHLEPANDPAVDGNWVFTRTFTLDDGGDVVSAYEEGSGAYGAEYVIDLDNLIDASSYSFYIEFARYDEASDSYAITGLSDTNFTDGPKTYAELEANHFIDAQGGTAMPAYWHGDGYVTPEPTSGLLVLIGLGLLGLKRRCADLRA